MNTQSASYERSKAYRKPRTYRENYCPFLYVCMCCVKSERKCFDLFLLIGTIYFYFYFNYGSMGLKIIDEWRIEENT